MDRELLEQRLAAAEKDAALAFEVVAEQRQVVAALDAWGQDSTTARRLLRDFEDMLAGFVEDWEYARVQRDAEERRRAG